ncbi:MAG: ureidoglycolate hydrolase [Alphaproteobacteria bacterium]|jgi:ureidoglycolate lyase|nr:ureidoglycolate hydrolase [Alphaproteobacteria bacterium]MBT4086565.1 ureidoglycolate hydrolase [Alphaproteobacteria bacterium]MBT4543125.1 ureidoglycolate hydrolase [Alphaproteobacteria bacterium]MBT7745319.1 ureidoglycolate hydrolase [Alphaproteobacteria bacterium]
MNEQKLRTSFDYMNPDIPAGLKHVEMPLVRATAENFRDYGTIVTDPTCHPVEIVTWPAGGWRSVDEGTGNEGGYMDGTFRFWWQGDVLYGENEAVKDRYVLGWSTDPTVASANNMNADRSQLLIWHANYHPDGGQLFYPKDGTPFVAALANTGDDMKPEDWVAFYCDGSFGVCIHPGIWHEAIAPVADEASFYDKQGAVHARVSADFPREFGCLMSVPLSESACK